MRSCGISGRRARNRLFEQRGLAINRKQRLRPIGSALRPETRAAATRDNQGRRRSGFGDSLLLDACGRRLAHRALCHQTCAPNSFSLRFEQRANLVERFLIARLEAQHQRGLRIGGAHQSPSAREIHPRPVDIDRIVVRAEVLGRLAHDLEFAVVGTVQAQFRREAGLRQISQQSRQAPCLRAREFRAAGTTRRSHRQSRNSDR